MKKISKFDIEKYYDMYRTKGFYDSKFYDFSIKQYEAEILVAEIKKVDPKNILIIGAFKGLSSLMILGETEDSGCKIYCIDPFFKNYYAGDQYGEIYKQMVKEYDVEGRIITVEGFATTPGKEVFELAENDSMVFDPRNWFKIDDLNTKFDFIFIDGDHSFDTALNDFIKSYCILSKNGVIAIHDTCDTLWVDELTKLIKFIERIPNLGVCEYRDGVNGITIVK